MTEKLPDNSLKSIFSNKKLLLLLFMGFSSGMPYPLTHSTIQAWMTKANLPLRDIGYYSSWIIYPYALKFIWAPILDRYTPPFLGRRRGWLFLTQLILIFLFCLIGFSDPATATTFFLVTAITIGFFSATQDIVVDAYRAEILEPTERGLGITSSILGYRIALIVAGSLGLYLAADYSWSLVYQIMAGFMLIGLLSTLIAKEPKIYQEKERGIKNTFIKPLSEFLTRKHAIEILAFVLLYKIGDVLAASLTTPFMIQTGFTLKEVGVVTKGVGFFATILGTLLGGALMLKMTQKNALLYFGIIQGVSTLSYLILAMVGKDNTVMAACIFLENIAGGMGSAAFGAFIMSVCNRNYTATQYALLTSVMSLTNANAGAVSGVLVESIGWYYFFIISTVIALPSLLMLFRYEKWGAQE